MAHLKFLAVGTAQGVVLVFDHFENFVKPALDSRRYGGVTCIDVSLDGNVMLVGHESGAIVIWDLSKKQVLKAIEDASPGSPLTAMYFLPSEKLWWVSVNSVGTVDLWTCTKVLFTYVTDHQCLLEGRGRTKPILASAVLFPTQNYPHLADRLTLIALAFEEVVLLVSLTPRVRIVHRMPRPPASLARPGVVPCMAWRELQLHEKPTPAPGQFAFLFWV